MYLYKNVDIIFLLILYLDFIKISRIIMPAS